MELRTMTITKVANYISQLIQVLENGSDFVPSILHVLREPIIESTQITREFSLLIHRCDLGRSAFLKDLLVC